MQEVEARTRIAECLRSAISDNAGDGAEPTKDNILSFLKSNIKMGFVKEGGKSYFSERTRRCGSETAVKYVQRILALTNAFPETMNTESGRYIFEKALLRIIRGLNGGEFSALDENFFRKNYRASSFQAFSERFDISVDGEATKVLAARLLDLAGRRSATEPRLLDSNHTEGLFFLAATEGLMKDVSGGVFNVAFGDLFPDDIVFPDEISFDVAQSGGPRVDLKVKFERIRVGNKPVLSQQEIKKYILRRYLTNWPNDTTKESDESIATATSLVLSNMLTITGRLFVEHMDRLGNLFRSTLNSGDLSRTVFDVEHGAIFVNQTDEGRYWTLAITPIQGRVHSTDRLISNEIIADFDNRLAAARTGLGKALG